MPDTAETSIPQQKSPCRVLMISADPAFLNLNAGTGDARTRHQRYAERVDSLDILVVSNSDRTEQLGPQCYVHGIGATGFGALGKAKRLGSRLIKSKNINLIVTQDPHLTGFIGLRLKRLHRIPLIVNIHGDFWSNPHWLRERWQHRIKERLQRFIVPRADALRVVSDGIAEQIHASGIEQSKIYVIHTPINDAVFTTLDDSQKLLLEKLRYKYADKFVLLFCGRLSKAKNLTFTLEVIEALRLRRPSIHLLVIGDGELRERVVQTIAEKHLEQQVTVVPPQPHDKLAVYFQLAQTLLLLSTNESFGKVIIEAGMAGTPAVASMTTGASHIIQDGRTGFLVPIGDLNATVDVLDEMIDQPEQTKQLGTWAQEIYREEYASEKTVERMTALWKRTTV